MEVIDDNNRENDNFSRDERSRRRWERREKWAKRDRFHKHTPAGRVMSGFVVVGIGSVLLARQLGVVMPEWLFTWEMLVIAIGIYIGAKHEFKAGGWYVPIIIGGIFIIDDIFPDIQIGPKFWPIFIIVAGLFMILSPKRKHRNHWRNWKNREWEKCAEEEFASMATAYDEDIVDSVSIFGNVKKSILSKNFKGGEITCIFGGAEINLTQADIQGKVILEVTNVFGGTRLIVPPHWDIKPEMVVVLAGIEDKRPVLKDAVSDPEKILIIRGTSVLGGIEISSY